MYIYINMFTSIFICIYTYMNIYVYIYIIYIYVHAQQICVDFDGLVPTSCMCICRIFAGITPKMQVTYLDVIESAKCKAVAVDPSQLAAAASTVLGGGGIQEGGCAEVGVGTVGRVSHGVSGNVTAQENMFSKEQGNAHDTGSKAVANSNVPRSDTRSGKTTSRKLPPTALDLEIARLERKLAGMLDPNTQGRMGPPQEEGSEAWEREGGGEEGGQEDEREEKVDGLVGLGEDARGDEDQGKGVWGWGGYVDMASRPDRHAHIHKSRLVDDDTEKDLNAAVSQGELCRTYRCMTLPS